MEDWQQRTRILLGEDKMKRLQQAHVLVVGLGGVGAYAAEMICRAGVGRMTIVDADTVQPTNINRQLPALHSTIGKEKSAVLAARFKDINPDIQLRVLPVFLKDGNIPELLDAAQYDFVVDAIDTLAPKCHLIAEALKRHIKIVSSMGAGAKSDITQGALCRHMGYVSLRIEQSGEKTLTEVGDQAQVSGCVQYRAG